MTVAGFRVMSGGQTGVDHAALDAALEHGIPISGYCPKGRRNEDGRIDERYPLTEISSGNYITMMENNATESDGTLILYKGCLSTGTKLRMDLAVRHERPCIVVDLDDLDSTSHTRVIDWIQNNKIMVLNVTGSRESECPLIYLDAKEFLTDLFESLQP